MKQNKNQVFKSNTEDLLKEIERICDSEKSTSGEILTAEFKIGLIKTEIAHFYFKNP